MFKIILLAVWINIAATAAILFSSGKYQDFLTGGEPGEQNAKNAKTVALPPVTVALIRDSGVAGYFILEVVFTYDDGKKSAKIPFEYFFRNAVVNAVYGNQEIDESQLQHVDLNELRVAIIEDVSKKIGDGVVQDVLIQSVDYRTIDEVRDKILRRLSQ